MQRFEQATEDPEKWHTEANVQAALVAELQIRGWRIVSVANTAKREAGIDVIAVREGRTVGVEVKGYPSVGYADPARAGEKKRTNPRSQAWNWYAKAVLAAMMLRGAQPGWVSAIALPAIPRFQDLYTDTRSSLDAAGIDVWWIEPSGELVGSAQPAT
jgi:Holliday junction resolvase-like predicted endonuclease